MRRALGIAAIAATLGGTSLAAAQVQGEAQITIQPGPAPQGQVYVQPQPYGYQPAPPPGYAPYPQQPQPQPYYAPQPAAPPQPRYVERWESIPGLLASGAIILPVSYVLTWTMTTATLPDACSETFTGSVVCRDIDYWILSWVPLVGPWFMLGQNGDGIDERALNEGEVAGALLSGLAQVTGLTLIILGAVIRRKVRVATYALGDGERAPQLSFGASPVEGGGVLGATLTHF
ncbi:MAG TPA: hypothetical protein VIL20_28460 [Sandaracinaceae bacterium]